MPKKESGLNNFQETFKFSKTELSFSHSPFKEKTNGKLL